MAQESHRDPFGNKFDTYFQKRGYKKRLALQLDISESALSKFISGDTKTLRNEKALLIIRNFLNLKANSKEWLELEKLYKKYRLESNLPVRISSCPYKGLAAFTEEDKDNFFGRDKPVDDLLKFLHSNQLLILVGNSGSGKSSIVFAGLVPKLENWLIASFRPANDPRKPDPFKELAASLVNCTSGLNLLEKVEEISLCAESFREKPNQASRVIENIVRKEQRPLLLIVDQFEEVFTLAEDKSLQNSFLDCIVEIIKEEQNQFKLILTMRSDFVSYALQHPEFSKALNESTQMLTAMSREELRETIEKPAKKHSVSFELGLVETILDDVLSDKNENDVADQLPLLEFALEKLWKKQERFLLTHEAYKAIGKVDGALTSYADKVFEDFNHKEQKRLEYIFSELVRVGEDTKDTKKICTKEQLGEENWPLVSKLASKRLLTTGKLDQEENEEETVEIIHEALIQKWGRFRDWINANREFIIWRSYLRHTIKAWEKEGKDESMLLRGRRLEQSREYLENYKGQLEDTKEFVQISTNKQKEREAKAKRRQKNLILAISTITAIFAVLAIFIGWLLVDSNKARGEVERAKKVVEEERDRALEAEREKEQQAKLARSNEEKANKSLATALVTYTDSVQVKAITEEDDGFPHHAALLAAQAYKVSQNPNTIENMFNVLQNLGHFELVLQGHNSHVNSVAFSPTGNKLVSAGGDGSLVLWNTKTGEVIRKLQKKDRYEEVTSVAFSPNSKKIISGDTEGNLTLWDTEEGEIIGKLWQGHTDRIASVAFSPDGKRVISGSFDKTLILWDVETGQPVWKTWSEDKDKNKYNVISVAFSPDGARIVSGNIGGIISLWDSKAGQLLGHLPPFHTGEVTSVAFSPDGSKVVSGSCDNTIRLWDIDNEEIAFSEFLTLLYKTCILSVAFSPDGKRLVFGDLDYDIGLINLQNIEKINESIIALQGTGARKDIDVHYLQGHGTVFTGLGLPHDPLADPSIYDGYADMTWGDYAERDCGHYHNKNVVGILSVVFSPDGKKIASGSGDSRVIVWDIQTENPLIKTWQEHDDIIEKVTFSPDNTKLISQTKNKTLYLWDTKTNSLLDSWQGSNATFSLDSKKIVYITADNPNTITLRGISTKDHVIEEQWQGSNAIFSPDGKKIAYITPDNSFIIRYVTNKRIIDGPWKNYSTPIRNLIFSPNSEKIAAISTFNSNITLWNVKTKEKLGGITANATANHGTIFTFSPDSSKFLFRKEIKVLELWDLNKWERVGDPLLHEGVSSATLLGFSPDGTQVLSGDTRKIGGGRIYRWDGEKGKPLEGLGTPSFVTGLSFSPNGKWFISYGFREWLLWSSEVNQSLDIPWKDRYSPKTFSPDNKSVILFDKEDTHKNFYLWNIDPDSWSQKLCAIAGRNFTREEWKYYMGDVPWEETCPSNYSCHPVADCGEYKGTIRLTYGRNCTIRTSSP